MEEVPGETRLKIINFYGSPATLVTFAIFVLILSPVSGSSFKFEVERDEVVVVVAGAVGAVGAAPAGRGGGQEGQGEAGLGQEGHPRPQVSKQGPVGKMTE